MTELELYQLYAIGGPARFPDILTNAWSGELLDLYQKTDKTLKAIKNPESRKNVMKQLKSLDDNVWMFEDFLKWSRSFHNGEIEGESLRILIAKIRVKIVQLYDDPYVCDENYLMGDFVKKATLVLESTKEYLYMLDKAVQGIHAPGPDRQNYISIVDEALVNIVLENDEH